MYINTGTYFIRNQTYPDQDGTSVEQTSSHEVFYLKGAIFILIHL